MLSENKNKRSAVLRQTFFITSAVFLIIVIITIALRVIVVDISLNSYSKTFINQINPARLEENRAEPESLFEVMERFLEDQSTLRRSLTSNKVVILDGEVINDPFKMMDNTINIVEENLPYLHKKDGIYYIFVGLNIFEGSKMVIGGPSLEITAFIETFDKISVIMILIGSFISLIVSYVVAKTSLRPVLSISNEISKIDITKIEKRIPEQTYEEFDVLSRKLNSMLERIQKAYENQNQFVSDVSHELRTPLTSINGYIKMLKRWGTKEKDVLEESLNNIDNSACYLKDMIEKLLILSKPEYDFEKKQIRIKDVFETLLESYKRDNIYINLLGEDFLVYSSKDYLILLFKIITENAIKYSKDKEEIKIDIILKKNIVKIKDYGIGIPKDKLDRIFERFYKIENSRTNKGHGLGLSIAKKIADALDIIITVNSKENESTTFSFIFK